MTLTTIIIETRRDFWRELKMRAPRINEGWCWHFAQVVAAKAYIAGVKVNVIWNEDADHAYLRHYDKLYDVERPRGVRRYTQLPAIARQLC